MCVCVIYSMCDRRVVHVGSAACVRIVVALKRAVGRGGHALGLHLRRGTVVVTRLSPQRRKAGGVPGGVYDRSGRSLVVCVERSVFTGASTCV